MRGVGDLDSAVTCSEVMGSATMGSGDMDSKVTCSEVMGSGDIGLEASMKASMTNSVPMSLTSLGHSAGAEAHASRP